MELPGKSRIATIQAALILSYVTGINSLDKLGTMYLDQAVQMARNLDLFELSQEERDPDIEKARIFTAWAVFSWQATYDYYYFRSPHLSRPPQIPLPDPTIDAQWYGETWVLYPNCNTLIPLHIGHKFKSETALHIIMNDIALQSFSDESPLQPLPHTKIIKFKERLDVWKNKLVDVLLPERLIFPHHLGLQWVPSP
jgi:hypothetical protein